MADHKPRVLRPSFGPQKAIFHSEEISPGHGRGAISLTIMPETTENSTEPNNQRDTSSRLMDQLRLWLVVRILRLVSKKQITAMLRFAGEARHDARLCPHCWPHYDEHYYRVDRFVVRGLIKRCLCCGYSETLDGDVLRVPLLLSIQEPRDD